MSPEAPQIIRLAGEPFEYRRGGEVIQDRVTLTTYNLQDVSQIFALIDRNRDFFTEYDDKWTDKPKYKTLAQFEESIRNPGDSNFHHFFIQNSQGEAVGGCRIEIDKNDPTSAEIGYFIDEAQTHKRYASRTVSLLIAYAAEELKLQKLTAFVISENIGSVTTLERNGFEYTGIDPEDSTYHWYERSLPTTL